MMAHSVNVFKLDPCFIVCAHCWLHLSNEQVYSVSSIVKRVHREVKEKSSDKRTIRLAIPNVSSIDDSDEDTYTYAIRSLFADHQRSASRLDEISNVHGHL